MAETPDGQVLNVSQPKSPRPLLHAWVILVSKNGRQHEKVVLTSIIQVNADLAASELAKALQPLKIVYLSEKGKPTSSMFDPYCFPVRLFW